MELYTVYGLVCPLVNKIVYVGYTGNVHTRYLQHTQKSFSVRCLVEWKKKLAKENKVSEIKMVALETGIANRSHAGLVESKWIVKLSKTHELLNVKHNKPKKEKVTPISISEYEKLSGLKIKAA